MVSRMFDGPDYHGQCDCERNECVVARAVRRAAAEACRTAVEAEYGSDEREEFFHLSTFPAREWACRAFPRRSARSCPGCGYTPWPRLPWVAHGATFAVDGKAYRIVSVGSTNRYSPSGLHFEDIVVAEPVSAGRWSLPELPATVDEVGDALNALNGLPKFRMPELDSALVAV